jgi:hypothetical protein
MVAGQIGCVLVLMYVYVDKRVDSCSIVMLDAVEHCIRLCLD